MTSFDVEAWLPFATAMVGAAAVLVGLIFVALSINLDALLGAPWLFRRAGAAITLLMSALVACAFLLVPGQDPQVVGAELALTGAVGLGFVATLLLRGGSEVDASNRGHFHQAVAWSVGIEALFVVAGVSLLALLGGALYWLVPAVLLCLGRAVVDSWVLLVEIKR